MVKWEINDVKINFDLNQLNQNKIKQNVNDLKGL